MPYPLGQAGRRATKVVEEIIKANADHVEAGVQLAELLDPKKKPEWVIAIVEPLLRLKHTYDLYHLLGDAHYQKENFNSARKNFEEAVKLNLRNHSDHYQLGNIYLSQKRFAKAARSYQVARDLGFSSGVFHFKLASVYFNLHNYLGRISTGMVLGGKLGEVSGELYLIDAVPGKKDTFHVAGPGSAVYHVAMAQKLGIDVFEIQFLEANVWLSAHYFDKAAAIYVLKRKVRRSIPLCSGHSGHKRLSVMTTSRTTSVASRRRLRLLPVFTRRPSAMLSPMWRSGISSEATVRTTSRF